MKVTIYWNTKDSGIIHRIRQRYNISQGMSINGETDIEVNEEFADYEPRKGFKCKEYFE